MEALRSGSLSSSEAAHSHFESQGVTTVENERASCCELSDHDAREVRQDGPVVRCIIERGSSSMDWEREFRASQPGPCGRLSSLCARSASYLRRMLRSDTVSYTEVTAATERQGRRRTLCLPFVLLVFSTVGLLFWWRVRVQLLLEKDELGETRNLLKPITVTDLGNENTSMASSDAVSEKRQSTEEATQQYLTIRSLPQLTASTSLHEASWDGVMPVSAYADWWISDASVLSEAFEHESFGKKKAVFPDAVVAELERQIGIVEVNEPERDCNYVSVPRTWETGHVHYRKMRRRHAIRSSSTQTQVPNEMRARWRSNELIAVRVLLQLSDSALSRLQKKELLEASAAPVSRCGEAHFTTKKVAQHASTVVVSVYSPRRQVAILQSEQYTKSLSNV
ncbi:MAG: hypothetical protein MHM6MM_004321 [Cercozoa sp. M6MM]